MGAQQNPQNSARKIHTNQKQIKKTDKNTNIRSPDLEFGSRQTTVNKGKNQAR